MSADYKNPLTLFNYIQLFFHLDFCLNCLPQLLHIISDFPIFPASPCAVPSDSILVDPQFGHLISAAINIPPFLVRLLIVFSYVYYILKPLNFQEIYTILPKIFMQLLHLKKRFTPFRYV